MGLLGVLLRAGADPGAQDDKGATALLLTSVQGIHAAITPLIDAKAAVDAQDQANDTALTAACSEGHRLAAEQLIACGASVNKRGAHNRTPLMIAIQDNYMHLADTLMKLNANVDDVRTWPFLFITQPPPHCGPSLYRSATKTATPASFWPCYPTVRKEWLS